MLYLVLMSTLAMAAGPLRLAEHQPEIVSQLGGIAVTVDREAVSDPRSIRMPLPRQDSVTLVLEPFDVFSRDVHLVMAEGIGREHPLRRPDVTLLRGHVAGDSGSEAFLAIGAHVTNGWIECDKGRFVIASHPRERWTAIYDRDTVDPAVLRWADVRCRVDELPTPVAPAGDTGSTRGDWDGGDCPTVRVAIETDAEFLSLFGGDTNAAAEYVTTLIGAVDFIYQRDVDVGMWVSYLRLWTTSNDPWNAGDTSSQLSQFQSYWNANMDHVPRHLAHMLSGRGLGGGVAWLSAVCSSYGYAVSANMNGSFPLPVQDHHGSNWDLMVVAHELGHNCGTWHTHDFNPPLDGCGLGDCSNAWGGTIMSYCHTCSGGMANMVMSLHEEVQLVIEDYLGSVNCSLGGDGSPPTASPDQVSILLSETIDIDVLANDWANNCGGIALDSADSTSNGGGSIEVIGDDPVTAVLRYTAPAQSSDDGDFFYYQIIDEDGQRSDGVVLALLEEARPPDQIADQEPGVEVAYYDLDNPQVLPDFDLLEPIGEEVVANINYPSTGGAFAGSGLSDDVGAVFQGLVTVPETGWYTLFVESDDGSRLYVGNDLLIDNDGLHGMVEQAGSIALQVGHHALRIEFFERGGGAGCIVRIEGGGLSKQVIPAESWTHEVPLFGDLNGDGVRNILDLLYLIGHWGPCPPEGNCSADLDGDGIVGVNDLLALLDAWG